MLNKLYVSLFLFLLLALTASAQNCEQTLSGKVTDADTKEPISFANVYLEKTLKGAVTDSNGFFKLSSVCTGVHHLIVSHIGCETREVFLNIRTDTSIQIELDHHSHLLKEISVESSAGEIKTAERESFHEKDITENTGKNLGTMLDNLTGVSSIKNGSGVAKPVVHGLYGNRLTILNNGVAQSGQQWGIDHNPEIDPLAAQRISVIKGVGALEYQGNSLGSIILIEPGAIHKEPHIHGKARYFYESNGNGNSLNAQVQQYSKKIAWRINTTLKKKGDTRSADYFLTNTGVEEANLALQLEKDWSNKWKSDLYLSSFNTNIGVLRGSHVGNLTDLQEALQREEPFFTENDFSYDINAPYQSVNHHLLKFHTSFVPNEIQRFDIVYSAQLDDREEFDVRRSGRTDIPALSLEQSARFLELKYHRYFNEYWKIKSGLQYTRTENTNQPETGVLPLIPDYISTEAGIFSTLTYNRKKLLVELGGRADLEDRSVASISNSIPREIIRYNKQYNNYSIATGLNYRFSESLTVAYNVGLASRNPEVNELYSNGLHQGVSGIEEGDPELLKENSLKNTLSLQVKPIKKLYLKTLFYYQNIKDYIFLQPQDEFRLTIRGAFPVFKYEQTNAEIYGLDFSANYQFSEFFNTVIKYSFIEGNDTENKVTLINIPANDILTELNYHLPQFKSFESLEFQLNGRYVFEKKGISSDQDFVAPPDAYFLLGARLSIEKQLSKVRLNFIVGLENALNETYRDYLNRQRYFADDLGRNVIVGVTATF